MSVVLILLCFIITGLLCGESATNSVITHNDIPMVSDPRWKSTECHGAHKPISSSFDLDSFYEVSDHPAQELPPSSAKWKSRTLVLFSHPIDRIKSSIHILSSQTKFISFHGLKLYNPFYELKPTSARILLLLCSLCYASNYSTTKFLQESMKPTLVTFLRFLIGSIYFIPSILRMSINWDLILGSMELGIWSGIGFIAQAVALDTTAAGKVSLFSSLSVVMPPLFDLLLKRSAITHSTHKPSMKTMNQNNKPSNHSKNIRIQLIDSISSAFISPMIAVLGACALEWGGLDGSTSQSSDIYLLVTPLAFALAFWRSETLANKYPNDLLPITGILLITISIISAMWATVVGDMPSTLRQSMDLLNLLWKDSRLLLSMLITGLLATAWTSLMEQRALRVLSAAEMTLIYSMEPLFASVFAWGLMDEPLTINMMIGAVFILIACVWDTKREEVAISLRKGI